MKSLCIGAVLFVLAMLFIGHLSVSFKPFSISLPYWPRSFGLIFIVIGFVLLQYGEKRTGYKKGYLSGIEKGYQVGIDKSKKDVVELKSEKTERND
ncbi:hypothetical protein [Bacteroides sp.]|uniref:hypothetical protein n=1 Tax=Bacteroides sp. TaxID=29523 RepID=UPI00262C877C|nr:hypothetical protein [Bacteroides sp.]MDD3041023.1 hypothetical protein [Bacteroides sp.]